MKRTRKLLVAMAACLVCIAVQAQWQWIDKDGRKVFSDRAPPAEIPDKSIVKRPSTAAPAAQAVARSAPAASASASAAAGSAAVDPPPIPGLEVPKVSGVDKDLAERKKQVEQTAAAKDKAEQERVARAKAENCDRAKANKALMESGVRVAQPGPNGERVVMDDAARQAEIKRAQAAMQANCS